jgi:lysozyme
MNWIKPPEIIPRREAEQRLFRDGIYPDGQIVVWQVNTSRQVIWSPAKTLSHDEALKLMNPKVEQPLPEEQPPASPLAALGVVIGAAIGAALGAIGWIINSVFGG